MGSHRALFRLRVSAGLFACVVAAAVFALTATASARSTARLTPAQAAQIATRVWSEREHALSRDDVRALTRIDVGALRVRDISLCRCGGKQPVRHAERVIALVPRSYPAPVFFAEILASDPRVIGQREWHFVALKRVGGSWRLAFALTAGAAGAPFRGVTAADGYAPAVPPDVNARVYRIASRTLIRAQKLLQNHTALPSPGVTGTSRVEFQPRADGLFGLVLPGRQFIGCFTARIIDTYSAPDRGLRQRASGKRAWGTLAPGLYSSITETALIPLCEVGTGALAGHVVLAGELRYSLWRGVRMR